MPIKNGLAAPALPPFSKKATSTTHTHRFPPEPNGYLHIGHAKSICLNFGLARDYQGACHLRFDDTNPEKEEEEYVNAIIDIVKWLGFDWSWNGEDNLYFASDYFEYMYQFAEALVKAGYAYVDEQSADEIRQTRGTLTEGQNSPGATGPAKNPEMLREMRDGVPDGSMALRANDMGSPNINMRDGALHPSCAAPPYGRQMVYPVYSWAHRSKRAGNHYHSLCTLEFEDQRPFYEWFLIPGRTGSAGRAAAASTNFALTSPCRRSKRKLLQLVNEAMLTAGTTAHAHWRACANAVIRRNPSVVLPAAVSAGRSTSAIATSNKPCVTTLIPN